MIRKKSIASYLGLAIVLLLPYYAFAAPVLKIGVAAEKRNYTARINFGIANNISSYNGVNAKIQLPTGIVVKNVSKGDLLSSMIFSSHHKIAENVVTIIAYSSAYPFSGDGILFTLELDTLQADEGTHPVEFGDNPSPFLNSRYALSDQNGNSVYLTQQGGYLAIGQTDSDADGLPDALEQAVSGSSTGLSALGDYDGDGKLNWAEFHNMTDIMDPYSFSDFILGDFNDDQWISLEDTIIALQIVTGSPQTGEVNSEAAINGEVIGIGDAIYTLQFVSELRD